MIRAIAGVKRAVREAARNMERQMTRVVRLTPARYGLDYEALWLRTRDDVDIAAWWVPGRRREVGVVLYHHFGGQRATLIPWIRLLHGMGLSAMALDGRGHGASRHTRRRGESWVSAHWDVEAACRALRERGAERLVLLGQSQGTLPILIEARRREDVAAVIVDCGPAATPVHAAFGLSSYLLAQRPVAERWGMALGMTGLMVVRGHPLRELRAQWGALRALSARPLLWIHGDADRVTPLASARRWYAALARPDGPWRRHIVAGGEHVRSVQADPEGVREAVERLLDDAGV